MAHRKVVPGFGPDQHPHPRLSFLSPARCYYRDRGSFVIAACPIAVKALWYPSLRRHHWPVFTHQGGRIHLQRLGGFVLAVGFSSHGCRRIQSNYTFRLDSRSPASVLAGLPGLTDAGSNSSLLTEDRANGGPTHRAHAPSFELTSVVDGVEREHEDAGSSGSGVAVVLSRCVFVGFRRPLLTNIHRSSDGPLRDGRSPPAPSIAESTYLALSRTPQPEGTASLSHCDAPNTIGPIHRIPNELLFNIILLTIADGCCRNGGRVVSLKELGRVCRWWKNLIETSASLWSIIDCNRTAAECIMRSANCTLRVIDLALGNVDRPEEHAVLTSLVGAVGRWRTLSVKLAECAAKDLEPLEEYDAPYLEICEIELRGQALTMLDLFRGCAPHLRTLHLRGIAVPPTSPLLFQVQDLIIHDEILLFTDFRCVIRNNPALVRLYVEAIAPDPSPVPPARPFHHTNLQHLVLGHGSVLPALILPELNLPNIVSLRAALGPQHTGIPSSTARAAIAHIVRHISSFSVAVVKMVWVVDSAERPADARPRFISTQPAPSTYRLEVNIPSCWEYAGVWMQSVVELLAPVASRLVYEVEFIRSQAPSSHIHPLVLDYLSNLRGLTAVTLRSGFSADLLPLLARPRLDVRADSSWAFPDLEEMALGDHCDEGELSVFGIIFHTRRSSSLPPPPQHLREVRLPQWAGEDRFKQRRRRIEADTGVPPLIGCPRQLRHWI